MLIRVTADGPFLPLIDKARLADLLGADELLCTVPSFLALQLRVAVAVVCQCPSTQGPL